MTLRRVFLSSGSAVSNFLGRPRIAVRLRTILTNNPLLRIASRLQTKLDLTVRLRPGIRLSSMSTGTLKPRLRSGIDIDTVVVRQPKDNLARPGMRVTQDRILLTGKYGANAWVQVPVGGKSHWVNGQNSMGKQDAVYATLTGQALETAGGQLDLSYADFPNKSLMTITRVRLIVWIRQQGAALGGGGLRVLWSKGGAMIQLLSSNVDVEGLAAPLIYDITASITGWSDLNALKTHVEANIPFGQATVGITFDAIELEVNAERIVNV